MSKSGHQELVLLISADESVRDELSFDAFQECLSGDQVLEQHAASMQRAAYCVVGTGLTLKGVAFFKFAVDEDGHVAPALNLPLRYLVQQAGRGPDLGHGAVRQASRSQCPVPWHAVNLWEPQSGQILHTLQKSIYRNRLKLEVSVRSRDEQFFPRDSAMDGRGSRISAAEAVNTANGAPPLQPQVHGGRAAQAASVLFSGLPYADLHKAKIVDREQNLRMASRLDKAFGRQGKLSLPEMICMHREQLNQARSEYQSQLKVCRDEIHQLKLALRQEQGRSRRLQSMLRGEI